MLDVYILTTFISDDFRRCFLRSSPDITPADPKVLMVLSEGINHPRFTITLQPEAGLRRFIVGSCGHQVFLRFDD